MNGAFLCSKLYVPNSQLINHRQLQQHTIVEKDKALQHWNECPLSYYCTQQHQCKVHSKILWPCLSPPCRTQDVHCSTCLPHFPEIDLDWSLMTFQKQLVGEIHHRHRQKVIHDKVEWSSRNKKAANNWVAFLPDWHIQNIIEDLKMECLHTASLALSGEENAEACTTKNTQQWKWWLQSLNLLSLTLETLQWEQCGCFHVPCRVQLVTEFTRSVFLQLHHSTFWSSK